jgi:branched-chain amino acid transport system permease protein
MLAQLLVSGLLLGCIYSLISMGLSLIWGVMGIVNFAHGAFVMLAMYIAYFANVLIGLDPLLATPGVAVAMFFVGLLVYYLIIRQVVDGPYVSRLLVTFGLSFFLIYMAQFLWSPDYRAIQKTMVSGTLSISGVHVEIAKLASSIGSIIVAILVYWFIRSTRTGQAIQAISTDRMGAALMGIHLQRISAISFGLGLACAGAAGSLLATFYYIFPDVASLFGLIALVAVALGGFGSIEGAFVGAIILGLVETVGGFYVGPSWKYGLMFILYLIIVTVRPQGLLGRGKV